MKRKIVEIITKAKFNSDFVEYIIKKFPEHFVPLIQQPYRYDFPDNPLVDLSVKDRLFTLLYELIALKQVYMKKIYPTRLLQQYTRSKLSHQSLLWIK